MTPNDTNARLIAAAPELLESCKYMYTLLLGLGYGDFPGVIVAKSVIAKAEGRE